MNRTLKLIWFAILCLISLRVNFGEELCDHVAVDDAIDSICTEGSRINAVGRKIYSLYDQFLTQGAFQKYASVQFFTTNGVFGATGTVFRVEASQKPHQTMLISGELDYDDGHYELYRYRRNALSQCEIGHRGSRCYRVYEFNEIGKLHAYLAITNGIPVYPLLTFEGGIVSSNQVPKLRFKP